MSYLKQSKRSKSKKVAAVKDVGMSPAEGREPVFRFEEGNDVTTVAAQVIMEKLRKGCDFNFSSYRALQMLSNDEINKSDCVILISASFLSRLGASGAAQQVLAESDEAAAYFTALGLSDKVTLSTFTTLITIMAPELLKAAEIAIAALMSETSKLTSVTHSVGRLSLALEGVTDAGIIPKSEADLSSLLTNFLPRTSRTSLAQHLLMESDSEQITPQESVSNANSRPVSESAPRSGPSLGMELTTANIMTHIKGRKKGKAVSFSQDFNVEHEPINVMVKHDKRGLGFVEESSSSEEEVIVRRKKEKTNPATAKGKGRGTVSQKILLTAKEIESVLETGCSPKVESDSESADFSI